MVNLTRKQLLRYGAGGATALALFGIGAFMLDQARWTSTNNAYVRADTVSVTPQTAGYVARVLVQDNETVKAGQELVILDASDALSVLAQAKAEEAAQIAAAENVRAQRALQLAQVEERAAALRSAKVESETTKRDLTRYSQLAQSGFVSDQRVDSLRSASAEANASVSQADAALRAQQRSVGALASSQVQAKAMIAAASAKRAQAELALARISIRAPVDGVAGAVAVRPGQYLQPGAQVMAIVPLAQTYIVANFKETQVAKLKIGQQVRIHADAFPGAAIRGRVESFAPASGAEFALIPVEHANGNFTKITQRIPVRIALEDSLEANGLRPGLSVAVKVDSHSPGGANFAQSAVGAAPAVSAALK